MATVSIGDQNFTIRSLTRKEIKSLRQDGVQLETVGAVEDYELRDAGLDKVFGLACTGGDPDELTQGQALDLWARVVGATYGEPESIKKSESPPPSMPESGGLTANSAGKADSDPSGTARKSEGKAG